MDAVFWDERYRSRERLFSGNPNGALVTEVADLPPGRALDVGCGEGADALWLADRGWQVTAVDIAATAVERATGDDRRGRVTWVRADLTTAPPPLAAFDLVSAQYFPLPRQPGHTALRALLNAVSPGGTLLVVGHDPADLHHHDQQEFDPDGFYHPWDVAELLDRDWTVLVDEIRPRTMPAPPGTLHTRDAVLRAQRHQ
jgi:SAM-dependent methyltransferase